MTNYEKLQYCSNQMSRLIALEEKYREAKISIEGEELAFSPQMVANLKQRFANIRSDIITTLMSITA